jgi:hypothetical protein
MNHEDFGRGMFQPSLFHDCGQTSERKMASLWLLTCVNVQKLFLNITAGDECGSLLMTAKLSSNQNIINVLPHCNWKKDAKCILVSK